MDNTIKPFTRLLLLTILICGLFLHVLANCSAVQASDVSDIPKPSVPEFTVKLVAHPYDVPSTTTTKIDPYTGEETVKTTPGYRVENRSIEIAIKNQPFTPYTDDEDHEINLYYNVRVKGHFEEEWTELYSTSEYYVKDHWGSSHKSPVQTSSEYTVLSLSADYPEGGQVDYQVNAHVGYYTIYFPYVAPGGMFLFKGTFSGWSSTQTLTIDWNTTVTVDEPTSSDDATIPNEQTTPEESKAPNDESFQIEHLGIVATVISVAALAIGLFVYFKIRKH